MARPRVRTPALRARVLATALELLEAEGASACTTRRIAREAGTSPPALYGFFGDKDGLLRAVVVEGFRQLGAAFAALPSGEPVADLEATVGVFRSFARARPALAELMFGRPFASFDPDPMDVETADAVRRFLVGRVSRCVEAGAMRGDPTDIAHAILALAMGLATQERGGWLGSQAASVDRRWAGATRALIAGFR